ncbi:DEKNAAC101437 [Brettanomyces naardenensis]|uniref:DEKNAAC101437 n=1 Tax=Brettanomyces naardenensis TaxID=13370 RepID=A0A448YI81_BRENA|nr:DEKNAAC101437 [Brettanomyces naardenensis]
MSSSLRNLSKRYGTNLDRFPFFLRKMFDRLSREAQLPALTSDVPELPIEKRFKRPDQWKVEVGDRVLITEGKYKGHVTKVLALHHPTNRIFLELAETKKLVVPKQFWQAGQSTHVIDYPKTVHPSNVKVVGTIVDTAADGTERERDIAADQLVFKGEYWDEDYGKMMPYRRVKFHENVIIPWPRPEPEEDCAFSTAKEAAEERTYVPNCLVRTDAPENIVESLRDPIMKRAYKWDKKYITRSEAKRLSSPEMPISEAKKAMFEEKRKIREAIPSEPSVETIELVGKLVAEKLNAVTDRNFAAYVNSVGPDARQKKKEARESARKVHEEKIREAEERNKIKNRTEGKYKLRKAKKKGSVVF